MLFLSTPSARRATSKSPDAATIEDISIHALREEGDAVQQAKFAATDNFYPRPPRGGRPHYSRTAVGYRLFLSTPSARRATTSAADEGNAPAISIHALREEGDPHRHRSCRCRRNFYPRPPRGGRPMTASTARHSGKFLSTPSARRATPERQRSKLFQNISIHALREEGDANASEAKPFHSISIHALREEGDLR